MREIKFRAWDGKQMCYPSDTNHKWADEVQGTPYRKLMYLPMSYLLGDSNDAVWLQYTGLKDKNGKEIYEGDILESKTFNEWGEYEKCTIEVKDIRIFYFRTMQLQLSEKEQKVIGNIYENPELLTK